MLHVDKVVKSFSNRVILKGVSLTLRAGEVAALIGPSGCGKSTLLRCINGLERFDNGEIRLGTLYLKGSRAQNGHQFQENALRLRSRVGMVFQGFHLFSHLSVLDNTMLAPRLRKLKSRQQIEKQARELLEKVGLAQHFDHFPDELSGGQQQRAAIARALALEPEILLYDEPTSALDPNRVQELLLVMKQLSSEGIAQLVVTHEVRFLQSLASQFYLMDDGKIVDEGSGDYIFSSQAREQTQNYLRHFV